MASSREFSAEEGSGSYFVSLGYRGQQLLRMHTRDRAAFDEWNSTVFSINSNV